MTTRSYRKYDEDFKQGAVALVVETSKPIAQVARDLGINEGARWATGAPRSVVPGRRTAHSIRTSGPSWPGCGGRTPSCGCSVMSSSARWPSG